MTAPSLSEQLLKSSAFQYCSQNSLQLIEANGSLSSFDVGRPISGSLIIPDKIHFLLSGKARLLESKATPKTLAILGAGSFVGLASLLTASSCEEVSASTKVISWAIPDSIIKQIYKDDLHFRDWCRGNLFVAELASLLQAINTKSEQSTHEIKTLLREIYPKAKAVAKYDKNTAGSSSNNIFFTSSANSDLQLHSEISTKPDYQKTNGPFDLRIISLPSDSVEMIKNRTLSNSPRTNKENIISEESKSEINPLPNRSSLNLLGDNPNENIKLVSASGSLDECLACFKMLAEVMELPFRKDAIEKSISNALRRGIKPNLPMLGQLVASMGLLATGAKVPASACTRMNVPCLIDWEGFALVVRSDVNGLLIAHPRLGWKQISRDQIEESRPDGFEVILVDKTNNTPEANFNFTWFLPIIKKYKSTLLLVLSSSFIVQLLTLANPLLIQVIIDKVISQRSLDTLQVLGIALVAATIFDGILSSLRTFMFTDTTNRIDMRLGAEIIDHLLRLPVGYFDKRPVGELSTRVGELEKIRNFLTGEALTTIIDAIFSIIYILVMAVYSWVLTLVALAVVPVQVAITLVGAPLFRRQFRQAAEENASTQSHLTEVLTGIQTVKAQNVEMVSRWKWQERYSKYIARTFEKTITGTALNQIGKVLQKLSQLMVLWVGASLVLSGDLTLGQLIAFRIISGYVTQPLLRLSTIWQRIQELRVSFERLADIVDTPEESTDIDRGKIPLPPIIGKVLFEDLQFSFGVGKPQVLKNINLEISAGTFVGIVGQSGSGKSTLMKLISRLYSPDKGKILIDDFDIEKVELYSLRRQIGIVPQEPLLFSGSINDNIALTDPNASSQEIAKAASIACAHEFIMSLDSGYSTELGERGANLSGGQRQRLAIARTLLSNPKLLVMDEATSALDYDTERRVCQNLRDSLEGSTVFFVTHRLSTVKNADLIVMMHQGAIVEVGSHDELMTLQGRYYALYNQQEAG